MDRDPALPALVHAARENRRLLSQVWILACELVRRKAGWDAMACAGCRFGPAGDGGAVCVRCWVRWSEKEAAKDVQRG